MKKPLILAAASSLGATMANAQTTVTTTGAARAAVQIEPEYRTKIRTYITEHMVRPVTTQEKIVVGAKVPTDVELAPVPSDWAPTLTKDRYVYALGTRVEHAAACQAIEEQKSNPKTRTKKPAKSNGKVAKSPATPERTEPAAPEKQ